MKRQKNLVLKRLREKNRVNEKLEVLISELSLEDLITLKLEISSKGLNNKLFGLPFWRNIDFIVKDSLIKFAVNRTNSIREAGALLGIRPSLVKTFIYKYGLSDDFSEKEQEEV
jgi:hypothetical protein